MDTEDTGCMVPQWLHLVARVLLAECLHSRIKFHQEVEETLGLLSRLAFNTN